MTWRELISDPMSSLCFPCGADLTLNLLQVSAMKMLSSGVHDGLPEGRHIMHSGHARL